jgi:hypothetical protein
VRVAAAGTALPANTPLAVIKWEAYGRTASDELYHAVWVGS